MPPVDLGAELVGVAEQLRQAAAPREDPEVAAPLANLMQSATSAGAAWAGSPIGYHSRVSYRDFVAIPAGARFSKEWGFMQTMSNETAGEWHEYTFEEVVDAIRSKAGFSDLTAARIAADTARRTLGEAKTEVDSILTVFLQDNSDPLIESLKEQVGNAAIAGTEDQFEHAVLPGGQIMSRDAQAMGEGLRIAPHLSVQAEVLAIEMLDTAAVALLVMTAEDERTDGAAVARQNVVHEAGLFQGRLGFAQRTILSYLRTAVRSSRILRDSVRSGFLRGGSRPRSRKFGGSLSERELSSRDDCAGPGVAQPTVGPGGRGQVLLAA